MTSIVAEPVIQYGFAGFSLALLGVVVWLIKQLLATLAANQRIVAANTKAIGELTTMAGDLLKLNRGIHDKLISRPCIASKEDQARGDGCDD